MNYVFDKKWFADNQKVLLFFCNAPIIKYWFRYVLRIYKDCSFKEKVIEIQPNNYKVSLGWFLTDEGVKQKIRSDFRTHNKFSKRLYYAFYPLWKAMHIWDLLADRLTPQFSFGFATLTVHPDPDPETTSVDGNAGRASVDESWASIHGGSGNSSTDSGASAGGTINLIASTTTDQWITLFRGIFLFDTSSIPDGDTIDSAVLSFDVTTKLNNLAQSAGIVSSAPASNTAIVDADYGTLGTTRYASDIDLDSITEGVYNDWTLNATGEAAIDKIGVTKFGLRLSGDLDNSEPTWSSGAQSRMGVNYADQTGTDQDPKLVIIHSAVAAEESNLAARVFPLKGI